MELFELIDQRNRLNYNSIRLPSSICIQLRQKVQTILFERFNLYVDESNHLEVRWSRYSNKYIIYVILIVITPSCYQHRLKI